MCIRDRTGGYLSGRLKIVVPSSRRPLRSGPAYGVQVRGACANNLQQVSVRFPLGVMTCVTGVSGSGKSSLVIETLFHEAQRYFFDSTGYQQGPKLLSGLENLDKVIDIDQSPIGRTPRSNPATYTGCLLYTSPSPRDGLLSRMPSSA